MARKRKQEEHENHERWLVSYADFITLLFAFFVVMYSISSVNEGKYRVLSSSLFSAFNDPAKTVDPIQYGTPLRAPIIQHKSMVDDDAVSRVGVDHQIVPSRKQLTEMQKIADELEHNLKELVDQELIKINKTNLGVEIEIKSSILFSSGSANLEKKANPALLKIAGILSKVESNINVEGFTDNVPIHTLIYPSNWELSAARASSVVRLFAKSNINPVRLKAIGFGEFRPVADNRTNEGRNKNRRVTIFVLNSPEPERVKMLEKKAKNVSKAQNKELTPINEKNRKSLNGTSAITTIPQQIQKLPTKIGDTNLIPNEKKSKPIRLPPPKLITIGKEAQ